MKIGAIVLLCWGTMLGAQKKPNETIGSIDFYGYQGLDVARVRVALPIQVGSALTKQTKLMIEKAVADVTAEQPTDVAQVCCDPKGHSLIYIGLRGKTFKPFAFNPVPAGVERLPPEIVNLSSRADAALHEAVLQGDAREDDSQGYALSENRARPEMN